MTRLAGFHRLVGAAAVTALSASSTLADNPKWGAHLDFEGRWGNARSLGDAGMFAPLWQSQTSLFFADIRGRFDSQDGREGNFGLGIRHMLDNGWNLGAYGYYDVRRTSLGNHFQQATLGIEALSADFDLRANVYAPFGRNSRDIGITGGNPFADFSNGSIEVVTPERNLIVERALTGFDGEIGWRAPVFDVNALTQVRVYGGGYYFNGGGVTRDIAGPRGRLEFSLDDVAGIPSARLTLGAEVQHDDVRSTQGFAIARLRVPLQVDRPAVRLTAQERRMTERIVRDVDIVSATGRGAQLRAEVREAAINTWNNQTVTTAEQITPTNQAALQATLNARGAGSVVILNGLVAGVTATTAVQANQTLIGGGTTLALKGATTGTPVVFTAPGAAGGIGGAVPGGGQLASVVALGAGSVVGGLTISNTALDDLSVGISARSAPRAVAFGNTVSAVAESGYGVFFESSDKSIVSGNTITTHGDRSVGVAVGGTSHGIVSGNTITSRWGGVWFADTSQGIISDNTITMHGADGFGVYLYHFFGGGSIVSGNKISTTGSNAHGLVANLSSDAIVSGNIFGPIGGDVISTRWFPFSPGSTGNSVVGPVGGVRCGNVDNTSSGTVYFTDGVNCVFP